MARQEYKLTPLTAISPLDGRYWDRMQGLVPFSSELAIIRTRTEVEARYLIALSEAGVVRPLADVERTTLMKMGPRMTIPQAQRVKTIEKETKHDVKAMERAFREFVDGTSLADLTERIHLGLTSEDINNVTYRLMLDRASKLV